MGKIGKPQKNKKKNKIKTFGWHKNNATLNRAPKSLEQEVPRRLLELGIAIKETQSGTINKNKYKHVPDAPNPNDAGKTTIKGKKYALKPLSREEAAKMKLGKKMQKLTMEATEEYINDLKPAHPFLENFQFKKQKGESKQDFMDRVRRESHVAVAHSKLTKKNERSAEFEIKLKAKEKLRAEKREKQKEKKLKEQETQAPKPVPEEKERKEEQKEDKDFYSLPDEIVPFGEVVHAPPTLSVLPKKAMPQGRDRPGARMPELKEAFSKNGVHKSKDFVIKRKKGKTLKRKHLTVHQQVESDAKREEFVELYRQMKKDAKMK